MGFRIAERFGMIPVGLSNGKLVFKDNAAAPIDMPTQLGAQTIPIQLNSIQNMNIRCYIKNDSVKVIIREDGSLSCYTPDTDFLLFSCKPGTVKFPSFETAWPKVMYAGTLADNLNINSAHGGQAYLIKMLNDKWYLFGEYTSIVGVNITEESYYMYYRKSILVPGLPLIKYHPQFQRLQCAANGKEFYVELEEILGVESSMLVAGGGWL